MNFQIQTDKLAQMFHPIKALWKLLLEKLEKLEEMKGLKLKISNQVKQNS